MGVYCSSYSPLTGQNLQLKNPHLFLLCLLKFEFLPIAVTGDSICQGITSPSPPPNMFCCLFASGWIFLVLPSFFLWGERKIVLIRYKLPFTKHWAREAEGGPSILAPGFIQRRKETPMLGRTCGETCSHGRKAEVKRRGEVERT